MAEVFIGLGANVGDPAANLRRAISVLHETIDVEVVSSLYRTEPVGIWDQPFFLNAVLKGRTQLEPSDLVALFATIEDEMGRQRDLPMGPRPLDLDLLLYDDRVIGEPGLTVPHARMAERRFVLAPLAEIAPDVVHPLLGQSADELLAVLSAAESVERVALTDWTAAPGG